MLMTYLEQQLKSLEEIATNPNLNGGLYLSFKLFIELSDKLLENNGAVINATKAEGIDAESLIQELRSIRANFSKTFDFELETSYPFGDKFTKKRTSRYNGHKFRKQLSNFIQSYRGHFLMK